MLLTVGYYNKQVGITVDDVFDTKNETDGGCESTESNWNWCQSGFYISNAHFLVHYIA